MYTDNSELTSNKFVVCNTTSPVWHCKNALKEDHPCNELYCNACKSALIASLGEHRPKRSNAGQTNHQEVQDDAEKYKCDHNLHKLESTDKGSYFESSYVFKKQEGHSCHYTTKCKKCNATICDKIPVGATTKTASV